MTHVSVVFSFCGFTGRRVVKPIEVKPSPRPLSDAELRSQTENRLMAIGAIVALIFLAWLGD